MRALLIGLILTGAAFAQTSVVGEGGADTKQFVAAMCQGSTAAAAFNLPSSGAPAAACVAGSNTIFGELLFDAASDESGQDHFRLGATLGGIRLTITWRAAATSGSVVWFIQTACVADGETGDPSWNDPQTVTDAVKGTTQQWNDAQIQNLTLTGCGTNEELFFRFGRDADNGADNMAGDAGLLSLRFTL